MKLLLDKIGDVKQVKRRRFIGTSRRDQDLWSEGGLSFGLKGVVYGSCDFAWFRDEAWEDPLTHRKCEQRPLLVIEATDCLNTRSWGSAQIQRFHHALGAFLCGINSVYFLNRGEFSMRPYLPAAAYFASRYHGKQANAAYMVTNDLTDIQALVHSIGEYGENSKEFHDEVERVLVNMLSYFNETFVKEYGGDWISYLESREIIRTHDGRWVKDIGARKRNFTDSSQRYGHIVLGEAITTKYLLTGSKMFDPSNDCFYYLLPLLTRTELDGLDKSLAADKEWRLLGGDSAWKVVTFDEIDRLNESLSEQLKQFRSRNLNETKKEWESTKQKLRDGLRNGTFTISANT
jgi:hypothetical protein